jgi:hypothetical protein
MIAIGAGYLDRAHLQPSSIIIRSVQIARRDRARLWLFTPGLAPFVNSTPAASRAARSLARFNSGRKR